jgi:hypothetical protein
MTICPTENEQSTPSIPIYSLQAEPVSLSAGRDASVPPQSSTSFYSLISFSGMGKTAVPVSDFVSKSFAQLQQVQAVLAGESADVLHVWVMIDEWTAGVRKQVYAIQKTIMKQLEGLHFDFYVIDLPEGSTPEEMVSDIPLVFKRA